MYGEVNEVVFSGASENTLDIGCAEGDDPDWAVVLVMTRESPGVILSDDLRR